jgi:hypothetical protein
MAAYPLNPLDLIETVDWATYSGQTILTTCHWQCSGPVAADGPAALQEFLAKLTAPAGLYNKMRQCQVTTLTTQRTTAQKVYPSRWAPEVSTANPNGQIAGADSPVNAAVSIDRKPAESGKGFVGRIQLAGWDYTGFTNGKFVTPVGQVAAYAAFITALKTAVTLTAGTVLTPVLINLRKSPVTVRLIVSAVAAPNTVRTMHRRTVGLGI